MTPGLARVSFRYRSSADLRAAVAWFHALRWDSGAAGDEALEDALQRSERSRLERLERAGSPA